MESRPPLVYAWQTPMILPRDRRKRYVKFRRNRESSVLSGLIPVFAVQIDLEVDSGPDPRNERIRDNIFNKL